MWLAIAVLALFGYRATRSGVRGRRIDSAPVCGGCRFNLSGVYPAAQTCPECGGDLSKAKAAFYMDDPKFVGFAAADGTPTATAWAYLTPAGHRVLVKGTGMTFDGGGRAGHCGAQARSAAWP